MPSASAITLDQLAAFNDEMAALARAGVPLDQGLVLLGGDMPGRLGHMAAAWGQRLARGESLPQIIEQDPSLPPAYRAVVGAGLRSGRLAVALEGVATVIRCAAATRRTMLVSLIYPLFVLAVAYGLFLFTLLVCQPAILAAYDDLVRRPDSLTTVRWLIRTVPYWGATVPLMVVTALIAWLTLSRPAWAVERGGRHRFGRLISPVNLLQAGRMATFADCLALLVEHEVPLPEAVTLATDASGDRRLRAVGRELGERLSRGESGTIPGTPPVLGWLLSSPLNPQRRVRLLRRTAAAYQRRARWMARWLSVYLPLWLTTTVGGSAVILYAASLLLPWCQVLYDLAQPL